MKAPCKDCLSLPICKAESYEYDPEKAFINSKTFKKCIIGFDQLDGYEIDAHIFLMVIRIFLRPDLDYLPSGCHSINSTIILEKSRRILNENAM